MIEVRVYCDECGALTFGLAAWSKPPHLCDSCREFRAEMDRIIHDMGEDIARRFKAIGKRSQEASDAS